MPTKEQKTKMNNQNKQRKQQDINGLDIQVIVGTI
jgi:hypothetical protein